jgi:alpha-tubulin suppressor-like RCC1 family protein
MPSRALASLLALSALVSGCEWIGGIDDKGRTDLATSGGGAGAASSSTPASTASASSSAAASSATFGAATGGGGAAAGGGGTSASTGGGASADGGAGGAGGGGVTSPCLAVCAVEARQVCADTTSDPAHCGSCDVACGAGVECNGGVCGRSLYRGANSELACASKPDGTLSCWGDDAWMQAGTGTSEPAGVLSPAIVADVGWPVRYAATTGGTTCALTVTGTLSCFGSNHDGEIGEGDEGGLDACSDDAGCVGTPFITFPSGILEVAAGGRWDGGYHFVARDLDGDVYEWAEVTSCNGDLTFDSPRLVTGIDHVIQLAAGKGYSCALRADGSVWCWGDDCYGTLGQGDADSRSGFAVVPLPPARAISGGTFHACAVTSDGEVYCWGDNRSGQLGVGFTATEIVPTPTLVTGTPGLDDVTQVAAGTDSTCALTAVGAVFCWGRSSWGLMGNGAAVGTDCPDGSGPYCQTTPTQASVAGVAEITIGNSAAYARLGDGTIWAWGGNTLGQLGDGAADAFELSPQQTLNFP